MMAAGTDRGAGSPSGAAGGAESAVLPDPVRGRSIDPRLPVFWLLLGLMSWGAWQVGDMVHRAISAYPVPALVALLLFTLYAVPFVLVVRAVDFLEREPPVLLAVAFGWGGLVATSQAIPANVAIRNIVASLYTPGVADAWGPALSAPLVEEVLKLLGVAAVALLARHQINSTLDGFVYGAMVGLGFQVVEDFVYAVNAIAHADYTGSADWWSPLLGTFLARGFLGGLWSHTMFSALAGAGFGYAMTRLTLRPARRIAVAALALAGAVAFHFVWNTPLLLDGFGFGLAGVVAVVVLKGLPGLVVVLLLVRGALRREADYYAGLLRGLKDHNLVTPDEVDVLVSGRHRLAVRREVRSQYGSRAAVAVRRLQRAQARLAVELSRHRALPAGGRPGQWRGAALRRRMAEVGRIRQRLSALDVQRIEVPDPPSHSWPGAASIVLGLLGVAFPAVSLVAIGLALGGLYRAHRRREVADSWYVDGLTVSCIGLALWLISYLIFDAVRL